MASFSFSHGWTYDVFVSFGGDTRAGFTGHLVSALRRKGIRTFIDEELPRGEEIGPSLIKAIEDSKIAIVVLSENYASSSWCLDQLVNISDRIEGKDRWIFPVFYNVDPSDVRHLGGPYGKALAEHEKRFGDDVDKVKKWKMALERVANLAGWDSRCRYEYELIDNIIEGVTKRIDRRRLHVADYPVGLSSRVQQVNLLLDANSDVGFKMVGIHGIGGIGKTTIAQAVYNLISDRFEASCFLGDVRQKSMKFGLVHLQEKLLSEIVGDKDIVLKSISNGISIIKQSLRHKKVLLVLDDVDQLLQLRAIVGGTDWFGSGSRVIITTRDKHLLASHGVDVIYEVQLLNKNEAFELLSHKAFKTDKVDPSYMKILKTLATSAAGLPLALEVLGSFLYGRSVEECNSVLDHQKRIPNDKILNVLKISFDSLEEDAREIFLDIACCFDGYKLPEVKDILHANHGDCVNYHFEVLVDKALISIKDGHVTLHELIGEMGREIVRQESPADPGRRSRLWFYEDILQVLAENTGTSAIQIINLDFPKPEEEVVEWGGESLRKMRNLRTLIIRNCHFSKGPQHLPKSLRVLEWWGYPSQSLPSGFHPNKLAILRLPFSCSVSLGLDNLQKMFMNMRVLNFDECQYITQISDVSCIPNLEELSFAYCENLIKIHESVGFLDKLRIMDAGGCSKLRTFPPIKLICLEQLNLSYCSSLESFPEILGKMENMTQLSLKYTAIKELPFSILNLNMLRRLELHSCGMLQLPSSIVMLPELEELSVRQCEGLRSSKLNKGEENCSIVYSNVKHLNLLACNISDEFIQIGLAWFANVKELDLSSNNFTILPACIKECCFLRKLNLDYCMHLREIGGIPPNLEIFSAKWCKSLKDLDLTVLSSTNECLYLWELILDDCESLQEIRRIPPNVELLSAKNCRSLTSSCRRMLLNQELHEAGNRRFCLPGTRIPDWFEHRSRGQSISFWFRNEFPLISLCLVGLMHKHPIRFGPTVIINGHKMKAELLTEKRFHFEFPAVTDHMLIFGGREIKFEDNLEEALLENEWNHVVVSIDIDFKWDPTEPFVMQTGLHVIKQNSSMDNVRFTAPYNHRFLKKLHELVDIEASQRQFMQQQTRLASFPGSSAGGSSPIADAGSGPRDLASISTIGVSSPSSSGGVDPSTVVGHSPSRRPITRSANAASAPSASPRPVTRRVAASLTKPIRKAPPRKRQKSGLKLGRSTQ